MSIHDDETLQMYVDESIEHLENIENDFLAIEQAGADIDENLVNKVYRAAHSIKGGAGFMGLSNIKDLTHEMENILGKIRSREMVPTPKIVNTLLLASDALKNLINNVLQSNEMDISAHVEALKAILEGKQETSAAAPAAPPAVENKEPQAAVTENPTGNETSRLIYPGSGFEFSVSDTLLAETMDDGKYIYLVEIDLLRDAKEKGKAPLDIWEEMDQTGMILSANMGEAEISNLNLENVDQLPKLYVMFATILKPTDINVLFEIDEQKIFELTRAGGFRTIDGTDFVVTDQPAEKNLPPAPEPPRTEVEPAEQTVNLPEEAPAPSPSVVYEEPVPVKAAENEMSTDIKIGKQNSTSSKSDRETSLRVHVSLLDQLMTLAGELVLSRNQLLQSMTSSDVRASEIAGQRIDLITSELQEAIMLTRMQSIGNVFNKFPRVVRDLAQTLGKNVELSLEGKEVELDKTIIEAIGDPLTHLVRNAVDHGIETSDIRKKHGKSPTGHIFLKAYHEAGQVNIEISDDGKGIDGQKLAQKATEKGLLTEDQAKVMSKKEKINLIFLPGFSTAEKITDVSGRGVGMDVVKTNLDKLGGLIDIDSELGKGSTIRIKLPLTLAIIPCQMVMTGAERYAIPQVNLEELLRIPADQVKDRIERVGNAEVVRLRGNLLPLVKLADIIGIEPTYIDPETNEIKPDRRKSIMDRRSKQSPLLDKEKNSANDEEALSDNKTERSSQDRRYHSASALNIVVVSTGSMKYGLVVEELHDSEEIVVKPLGRHLKRCKGYAGATIMGDGRVALILDVSNLAQMAGLTSVEGSRRAADLAEENKERSHAKKDSQSFLVFRSAENEQFAAPLNLVERIEKIKESDIEEVGGKRVIKYRGGSLPLFSIDQVADVKPLSPNDNLLVIVFIVAGKEVGLLAIGPVDAIEISLDIDPTTLKQPGIMGSAIINEHTTLLVDIFEIVQSLNPEWFQAQESVQNTEGEIPTILFAEDSNFFRNQVKGSMVDEGYTVLEAEDGVIAWDLLQEHSDEISLVVTDIEMPNLNGFELTKKIKTDPHFSHLPVIALTTLAGEEDIAMGRKVGIDDYQIKLDREKLLQSIYAFLKKKYNK